MVKLRVAVASCVLALLIGLAHPAGVVAGRIGRPGDQSSPTAPAALNPTRASREMPYVAAVSPTGSSVRVDAAITVTYGREMVRSSVENSFDIQPQVDGALSWTGGYTLRFKPVRLLHGVTYQVRVGGRSTEGLHLKGPRSWQFTTVLGPALVVAPGPSLLRVPILMYHYIRINPDPRDQLGFRLSVTPSDFAAQMDWLTAYGYHPITFAELNAFLAGGAGLPSRPIILSFDDGYSDFYSAALPVLVRHDFQAVAYVISSFVGQPGYMSADQVRAADRAGIEIGSHTVSHVDLTKQPSGELRFQLVQSRQTLEKLLGHPVLSFCYPIGRFNGAVVAAVEAAGYRDATTTQYGSERTLAGRYTWGRLRISGGENLAWFAADVLRAS